MESSLILAELPWDVILFYFFNFTFASRYKFPTRIKARYLGRGGWQGETKSKPLIEDVGENIGEDEEEDNPDPGREKVEPPGQ